MTRWQVAGLGLCLAGCSWVFDDSAPELPLIGEPPVMERYLKLNQKTARDVFVLLDAADKPWAVIPELPELPVGLPEGITLPSLPETLRLVRLDPQEDPQAATTYPSQYLQATLRSLYVMVVPALFDPSIKDKSVRLSRIRPGEPPLLFEPFPEGTPVLLVSGNEQVGVMFSQSSKSKSLRAFRMDGSGDRRELPIPEGVDPAKPFDKGRYQLVSSGEQLIVQDGSDNVTVYATRSGGSDKSLGKLARSWQLDSRQQALLACSDAGLVRLPLDGSNKVVLDSAPCATDLFRVVQLQGSRLVLYRSGDGLRQVPEDGSGVPTVRIDAIGQLLTIGPAGELLYSRDPSQTYGAGIGSGFLGDRQVMERGRRPAWSGDRSRLRYLEWAARSDNAGDFHSRLLSTDEVTRLARNVRLFGELSDGRVLAVSNAVPRGTHNRIIVIDEEQKQARWVADSSREFLFIPGSSDLLVKVVIGQTGWDIRRVPILPK
ncbi:MAG: hypothetical protein JNM40_10375 [Myxococcales bacterium]|nr:hypothetical protein [Myxococcales bacterium]